MLVENKKVRQRLDEGFRRWFIGEGSDLILWYDGEEGKLLGFQYCYDKYYAERAITWKIEEGQVKRSHRFVSSSNKKLENTGLHLDGGLSSILTGDAGTLEESNTLKKEIDSLGDLDRATKSRIQKELDYWFSLA